MSATQQHNSSLIFTGALMVAVTVLILLALPLLQSVLEAISGSVRDFLAAFSNELGKMYGR